MERGFNKVLDNLPELQNQLKKIRETLLANLVMISEIPAPTFKEHARTQFLLERFTEGKLQNCSTDEVGNALGILPGKSGDGNIVIVAHMDTVFNEKVDHTISVTPDHMIGPGVGDNALGVAAVASLPYIMETLNIELNANLVLMGSSRSLGRGDIEGLRFFLENTNLPISAGVSVEGVMLGRVSYSSIGMMRCEISYNVPEEYDWTRFGAEGSIVTINEVINRILEIPLPRRPRTTIILGSIEGGTSFNNIARSAILRFEVRSEDGRQVQDLSSQIESIAAEISSHTGSEVAFNVYARREPGGIDFSHPLAKNERAILKRLKITPRISPSTSELSAFIDKGIPAVTLGLTNGENMNQQQERIELQPIEKGLAQLISLITAIDKGYCYEKDQ